MNDLNEEATKQEMKARDTKAPRVRIGIIVVLLIVLGYLVISIRNWPGFRMRRQIALSVYCSSNLSGLWKAMRIYSEEYDQYPAPEKWCDALMG